MEKSNAEKWSEYVYSCTFEKFNGEVSEYLGRVFGEPTIKKNKNENLKKFSYSSIVFNGKVNVKVETNYKRTDPLDKRYVSLNKKYVLDSKIQILLKLPLGVVNSTVKDTLEKILENK